MVYNSANVAGASRARHARSQGQCALPNERWQAAAVEATASITTHLPAQIKGEIERTTRVAAWSAVQDRLLLVQRWQGTKIAELKLPKLVICGKAKLRQGDNQWKAILSKDSLLECAFPTCT